MTCCEEDLSLKIRDFLGYSSFPPRKYGIFTTGMHFFNVNILDACIVQVPGIVIQMWCTLLLTLAWPILGKCNIGRHCNCKCGVLYY